MSKTRLIQFFIIFFVIVFSPIQLLSCAHAATLLKDETTGTAKIIFSINKTGQLTALVIPYTADGRYPKSGWIRCDTIALDIVERYIEQLKDQEKSEGYFMATYKKIGKDDSAPILTYKGELTKLEPWNPEFIKTTE